MEKNNATWLFIEPSRNFHSSESFWTSLFALHVLMASAKITQLKIKCFQYVENGRKWGFEDDGYLTIPEGVKFSNIVVEGSIRNGFLDKLKSDVPKNLLNLRPDVLIFNENRVIIVEVKTVGNKIGDYQLNCYLELADFIGANGYSVELYFMISAGHEVKNDLRLLRQNADVHNKFKLILWEHILKQVCEEEPISPLATCLGDIAVYYKQFNRYMMGEA